MAIPHLLTTLYATAENTATRASGDFAPLCPDWQKLASGPDGVFAAGSPWVLTSASVDFEAAGVGPQHVVLLRKPTTTFKGSGEFLAVDGASGHSITLRRLGTRPSQGQPPAPEAG